MRFCSGDNSPLTDYTDYEDKLGVEPSPAVPKPDHYLPLLCRFYTNQDSLSVCTKCSSDETVVTSQASDDPPGSALLPIAATAGTLILSALYASHVCCSHFPITPAPRRRFFFQCSGVPTTGNNSLSFSSMRDLRKRAARLACVSENPAFCPVRLSVSVVGVGDLARSVPLNAHGTSHSATSYGTAILARCRLVVISPA